MLCFDIAILNQVVEFQERIAFIRYLAGFVSIPANHDLKWVRLVSICELRYDLEVEPLIKSKRRCW